MVGVILLLEFLIVVVYTIIALSHDLCEAINKINQIICLWSFDKDDDVNEVRYYIGTYIIQQNYVIVCNRKLYFNSNFDIFSFSVKSFNRFLYLLSTHSQNMDHYTKFVWIIKTLFQNHMILINQYVQHK